MSKRSGARQLSLWMNGQRVGVWAVVVGVDELTYDASWVQSAQARPLSLSLPFTPGNQAHRGPLVRACFENLLPDSQAIRERLARRFRASSLGAFDLLSEIGRDCVGALQILSVNESPGELRLIEARPMNEAGVASAIRTSWLRVRSMRKTKTTFVFLSMVRKKRPPCSGRRDNGGNLLVRHLPAIFSNCR